MEISQKIQTIFLCRSKERNKRNRNIQLMQRNQGNTYILYPIKTQIKNLKTSKSRTNEMKKKLLSMENKISKVKLNDLEVSNI